MLDLPAADGAVERFDLLPDERTTRSAAVLAPVVANAAIELTVPMVTPITEALTANDAELAAFWKAESGRFRYDYMTFRVTFAPPADARFERGWVEVGLGDGGAIAWSMSPYTVADTTKVTQSGKLGAEFKLVTAELGTEHEVNVQNCFIRAWREQTERPYWEFQRTDSTELAGTFRLHLVVRSPANLAVSGAVSARTVLNRRTYLIFRRNETSGPASIAFRLAPA